MNARKMFCLSGVGSYDADVRENDGIYNLTGVPTEIRTMRRALNSIGLTEYLPFTEDERRHDELERGLTRPIPEDVETLVIYCTGHGALESTRYHLLLPDGMPFEPHRLIVPLEKWEKLQEVVLIIDACSAEPGLDAAQAEMRKVNTRTSKDGFWGIGASRRLEKARELSFAAAFAAAVERHVRPSWTVSHLDPGALTREIDKALGPEQTVWLADGHPATPCRALPNPRYQNPSPPTGLPIPADWATRARGVPTPDFPGFFFTGRRSAMETLREYLSGDDDVAVVVTARPRAGRGALLGHLVLTTHEDGRRVLPGEVRVTWPELPVGVKIVAGRGDPTHVTRTLARDLTGSSDTPDLGELVRSAPMPLGVVLDELDESTAPELWAQFFGIVRSVPGVRLIVGLPTGSPIRVPGTVRIVDLDDLEASAVQDVRDFIDLQVRLAVPGAAEPEIRRAVDVLAARVGPEFGIAVAIAKVSRPPQGTLSADEYLARATRAADEAAHRECRTRAAAVLSANASRVVSALSALCSYDETVALPAAEWAAAASGPDRPVEVRDVVAAARLMYPLVEQRPAEDGTARWRPSFGHPDAAGYPKPEVFLQRLPQVADWAATDWQAADPAVLILVARAAVLGLIPGRMLDDPAFLLSAPPAVVSAAMQQVRGDGEYRARRSRMWRLVREGRSPAERALLLRIGAQRFGVTPVLTAYEISARSPAEDDRRLAHSVVWVQPDRNRDGRMIRMTGTSAGPGAVVVTTQDDGPLSFWDPSNGTSVRRAVQVPGGALAVTAAIVQGKAVALVSTWQGEIWLVPCRENAAPSLVSELMPPRPAGDTGIRTVPLLPALHPGGHVVVAAGTEVWTGGLRVGGGLRKRVTMDSELVSVHTAGPVGAAVAWLVPESGRVRLLRLDDERGPAVLPFPVPRRPFKAAVSEAGDRVLILDINGGLHLRGLGGENALNPGSRYPQVVGAIALGSSAAGIVGGAVGQPGWLEVYDLTRPQAVSRVPLDEAGAGVIMPGDDRAVVARASGLLCLRWTGLFPERAAERQAHGHG
jgi:hypothetical protein